MSCGRCGRCHTNLPSATPTFHTTVIADALPSNSMSDHITTRAGRVRGLTRSRRSKFKTAWHQFSTVQFLSYQVVLKVRSVHVMGAIVFKYSASSVPGTPSSVQLSSVETPDGDAFGVLLGIPQRVPVC